MYRKNVAGQVLGFCLVNATTGAALTGATVTASRVIDGGAQATATGTTTEKGLGQYSFALSQADTNGNNVSLLFTATNAVPVEKTIVTTAADPTAATNFGLTNLDATVSSRSTYAGGAVASVTGAVGSVAAGGITSGSFAAGAINAAALAADAITAAKVADGAIDAATFAAGAIDATAFAQAAADKVWSTTARVLTAGTNVVLAKGTGITGFNDLSTANVAAAVWNEDATGHQTQGTFGQAIGDPGADTDSIWALANTNLDAAISSRSTYAGGDTAGTTTLLSRLTSGRATGLDNLDATISSRMATFTYTAPPTAVAIADAVLTRDVSNVESTAPEHSLAIVILATSEWSISGSTWTIFRSDGTTPFASKPITVVSGQITGVS